MPVQVKIKPWVAAAYQGLAEMHINQLVPSGPFLKFEYSQVHLDEVTRHPTREVIFSDCRWHRRRETSCGHSLEYEDCIITITVTNEVREVNPSCWKPKSATVSWIRHKEIGKPWKTDLLERNTNPNPHWYVRETIDKILA